MSTRYKTHSIVIPGYNLYEHLKKINNVQELYSMLNTNIINFYSLRRGIILINRVNRINNLNLNNDDLSRIFNIFINSGLPFDDSVNVNSNTLRSSYKYHSYFSTQLKESELYNLYDNMISNYPSHISSLELDRRLFKYVFNRIIKLKYEPDSLEASFKKLSIISNKSNFQYLISLKNKDIKSLFQRWKNFSISHFLEFTYALAVLKKERNELLTFFKNSKHISNIDGLNFINVRKGAFSIIAELYIRGDEELKTLMLNSKLFANMIYIDSDIQNSSNIWKALNLNFAERKKCLIDFVDKINYEDNYHDLKCFSFYENDNYQERYNLFSELSTQFKINNLDKQPYMYMDLAYALFPEHRQILELGNNLVKDDILYILNNEKNHLNIDFNCF